ncbi:hypothetical protein D9757_008322 [Collybiopsis confluens]|uniref:Uncharacterized protein n=1 Tax=Collybiopsis confluens TaxID=2823264 RepID=A0A8H5M5U9_9AGAR|nr:hypothetical protein D9757_008322 [Collybiopsis confluens]
MALFTPSLRAAAIRVRVDVTALLDLRNAELDSQGDEELSDGEFETVEYVPPPPPHSPPTLPVVTPAPSPLSTGPPPPPPCPVAPPPFPGHAVSPPSAATLVPSSPGHTYANARQRDSHRRRKRKREHDKSAGQEGNRAIHKRHRANALANTVQVEYDCAKLPVDQSGFGGRLQRLASDRRTADVLCAQPGWRYLKHEVGGPSTPIVDINGRLMVLVASHPRELRKWQSTVMLPLENDIIDGASKITFTNKQLNHDRGGFPALAIGVSYGGGETTPLNRSLSNRTAKVMNALIGSEHMKRASGYMNQLLKTYNPLMYEEYHKHQTILHKRCPYLRKNFTNSVWSSLTVNFGPQTVTRPHVDARNRPDGWCPILAGGNFDFRRGGQLVLPDLKLVIEFAPGCVIFLPSALLIHYNCPIQAGETRYSITQYTAGGLVRWVSNGFQGQKAMLRERGLSDEEWGAKCQQRRVDSLRFFPVIV